MHACEYVNQKIGNNVNGNNNRASSDGNNDDTDSNDDNAGNDGDGNSKSPPWPQVQVEIFNVLQVPSSPIDDTQ